MAQLVYFEDGELVVELGKAKFKNGVTTPKFEGEFVIPAHALARILSDYSKKPTMVKEYNYWGGETESIIAFLTDNLLSKEILRLSESVEYVGKRSLDLDKENQKLRKAIDEFNSTRRWWERKFKYE